MSDGLSVISTYNRPLNLLTRTVLKLYSRIYAIGPTGQVIVLNGLILALMKPILKQSLLPIGNGLNPFLIKTYLEESVLMDLGAGNSLNGQSGIREQWLVSIVLFSDY